MEIYSTLTRSKETFETMNDNRINLFVCGPTVYDDAHIGHGRTYISFDTIKRYWEYKGYTVFYIQNITDVDDKIIKRSKETGIPATSLHHKRTVIVTFVMTTFVSPPPVQSIKPSAVLIMFPYKDRLFLFRQLLNVIFFVAIAYIASSHNSATTESVICFCTRRVPAGDAPPK